MDVVVGICMAGDDDCLVVVAIVADHGGVAVADAVPMLTAAGITISKALQTHAISCS